MGDDVSQQLAPAVVVVSGTVVLHAMVAVVTIGAVAFDNASVAVVAMGLRTVLALVTATSFALEESTDGVLGATPHGVTLHLADLLHLHMNHDDLTGGGLDKHDLESGDAADEAATDLDDPELDTDDLHLLLFVHSLLVHDQAVSQHLILLIAVALDQGSGEVAVPRVDARVHLEAVERQDLGVLDHEVEAQVALALALQAGDLDGLHHLRDGEGHRVEGQGLDVLVVALGHLHVRGDKEGGGRGREGEGFEHHGGGRCTRGASVERS